VNKFRSPRVSSSPLHAIPSASANSNVMMEQGRKMMEFSKEILQKVSFDRRLFRKELMKAKQWVGHGDQLVLKAWCLATFGHMYKDVIMEVFQTTMRT